MSEGGGAGEAEVDVDVVEGRGPEAACFIEGGDVEGEREPEDHEGRKGVPQEGLGRVAAIHVRRPAITGAGGRQWGMKRAPP